MNFTHEQLRNLGYQPSPDGTTYTRSTTAGLSHAQPQPDTRPALGDPREGENPRKARTHLVIERCACSLLDADNFAGGCKPLIDQLRYAKLIADDDPESVEITFRQTKVKTKKEEGTKISIETRGV